MPPQIISVPANGDDGSWNTSLGTFDGSSASIGIGNTSASNYVVNGFFRFTGVAIPPKAKIISAYITFIAPGGGSSSGVVLRIYANAADNATAPTDYTTANGKALSTAYVAWSPTTTAAGTAFATPSIITVIQEIVDRASWASGNALMILIKDNGSTVNYSTMVSGVEHSTYAQAVLTVIYDEGGYGSMCFPCAIG